MLNLMAIECFALNILQSVRETWCTRVRDALRFHECIQVVQHKWRNIMDGSAFPLLLYYQHRIPLHVFFSNNCRQQYTLTPFFIGSFLTHVTFLMNITFIFECRTTSLSFCASPLPFKERCVNSCVTHYASVCRGSSCSSYCNAVHYLTSHSMSFNLTI